MVWKYHSSLIILTEPIYYLIFCMMIIILKLIKSLQIKWVNIGLTLGPPSWGRERWTRASESHPARLVPTHRWVPWNHRDDRIHRSTLCWYSGSSPRRPACPSPPRARLCACSWTFCHRRRCFLGTLRRRWWEVLHRRRTWRYRASCHRSTRYP